MKWLQFGKFFNIIQSICKDLRGCHDKFKYYNLKNSSHLKIKKFLKKNLHGATDNVLNIKFNKRSVYSNFKFNSI